MHAHTQVLADMLDPGVNQGQRGYGTRSCNTHTHRAALTVSRQHVHICVHPHTQVLADMLDPGVNQVQILTELRLNKCGIPEAGGLAIAKALTRGNDVGEPAWHAL